MSRYLCVRVSSQQRLDTSKHRALDRVYTSLLKLVVRVLQGIMKAQYHSWSTEEIHAEIFALLFSVFILLSRVNYIYVTYSSCTAATLLRK